MSKIKPSIQDHFPGRGDPVGSLLGERFPTRKNEAWHYTPLQVLDKMLFQEPPLLEETRLASWMAQLNLPQSVGQVVFANGRFVPSCSFLPDGVKVGSALSSRKMSDGAPFSQRLNEALEDKGLDVHVAENCHIGTVILLNVHEGDGISTHVHHKISLGKGASLTLLEVNVGHGCYLANPVFEIVCAELAHFTHVKDQNESREAYHLAYISASLEKKSVYESFTLQSGGNLARHEVSAALKGEQAVAHVNAVQMVTGTTHHDLTSLIHHVAPHCQSRQTVRTVLEDQGTGVFQGKVLVDQRAQKTDGYQMNQALLLSDSAQMNSKPELEIYADDVRCSHGATVGALDEEQLFYLRSRGVEEQQARSLLIRAFLNESLDLLENQPLRDYLLERMRFHG